MFAAISLWESAPRASSMAAGLPCWPTCIPDCAADMSAAAAAAVVRCTHCHPPDEGCGGAVTAVTLNRIPLRSWTVTDSSSSKRNTSLTTTPKLTIQHLGLDFFDVGDATLCVHLSTTSACPYWGAFCHYDGGKCNYRIIGGGGRAARAGRSCCMSCELYGGGGKPGSGGDDPSGGGGGGGGGGE